MQILIDYGIDLILIIVLLSNIIGSYRRGFFKCLVSLVCVIVALFAALNYSQPLAEWSYDNIMADKVVQQVEKSLNDGFSSQVAADTVNQVIDMIPELLTKQLTEFGIDTDSLSGQIASLELSSHDTAEKISEQIIRPGSLVLLKLLCYILIFVVVRLVLGCILGLITKLPMPSLLKTADRWLGGVLGALKGGVIVIMLCMLLTALSGFVKADSEVATVYENSRICAALNDFGIADLTEMDFDIDSLLN